MPLAALCEYTSWPDLGPTILRLVDRLYSLVPPARLVPGGYNVCIYQAPGPAGTDLEVGAQAHEVFDPPEASDLYCTTTPAGRAAHVTYFGDYARLVEVHQGIEAWCQANCREPEGTRWEVYGFMAEDPAERRTDVYWLLTD